MIVPCINNNEVDFFSLRLNERQFDKISKMVYRVSGIDLHQGKEELVKARLLKRLRVLRIANFDNYLKFIERDKSGNEISEMVDVLTTNKTNFFREAEHLNFLRESILPHIKKGKIRIWSAGCSSGEEAYSIAMVIRDALPEIDNWDVKILATDISERMLEKGRDGMYSEEMLQGLTPQMRQSYFKCIETSSPRRYRVLPSIRAMVYFAKLNLMEDWPMTGQFDVIFCRNVMIYFDKPTQEKLVKRFWDKLSSEGYLMIGHSESLTFLTHNYRYVKPAVYRKLPKPLSPTKEITKRA